MTDYIALARECGAYVSHSTIGKNRSLGYDFNADQLADFAERIAQAARNAVPAGVIAWARPYGADEGYCIAGPQLALASQGPAERFLAAGWTPLVAATPSAQAEPDEDECPHGNAYIVRDCLRCGAPVCCNRCCAEDWRARQAAKDAIPSAQAPSQYEMTATPTPEAIIRAALDIALDLATSEAAHVHEMYAGYKPHKHAAIDKDVQTVKDALTQLDELSGQIAELWEQLSHRDRIAEDLRAAIDATPATVADREDAARYRWLRDPKIAHWQMYDKHGCMVQGKELDAAIDAAIRPNNGGTATLDVGSRGEK